MEIKARKITPPAIGLEEGLVYGTAEEEYLIATDTGEYRARPAASCLLEPAPGDRVLMSLNESQCFILAILTREPEAQKGARLTVPGDLTLAAPQGSIRLAANREMDLNADRISLKAVEGQASFKKFSLISQVFTGQFERIKAAGRSLDNFFDRVVSRFHSNYRYVEEHEEVQAGSMRQLVDGTLTIQTENTVHTAEEHIKLDADQIHLA